MVVLCASASHARTRHHAGDRCPPSAQRPRGAGAEWGGGWSPGRPRPVVRPPSGERAKSSCSCSCSCSCSPSVLAPRTTRLDPVANTQALRSAIANGGVLQPAPALPTWHSQMPAGLSRLFDASAMVDLWPHGAWRCIAPSPTSILSPGEPITRLLAENGNPNIAIPPRALVVWHKPHVQ